MTVQNQQDTTAEGAAPEAQVEITGRNVEVPEHFAERVNAKLAKVERLDPTLTYFHVELQHERNPRRADESDRIQITASGKGHIARAEAKEDSFYAALRPPSPWSAHAQGEGPPEDRPLRAPCPGVRR